MAYAANVGRGKEEQAFFVQLGARIAQLRKDQAIIQVQLAEWLGVSQQTITAYESAADASRSRPCRRSRGRSAYRSKR